MRVLIVGAGASYAEALEVGLSPSLQPPLISNFAQRLWFDYNPHLLMSVNLRGLGFDPGLDARAKFLELERDGCDRVNIERFFECAYKMREFVIPDHDLFDPSSEYENLLLHGILSPLTSILGDGLLSQIEGGEFKLPLTTKVASIITSEDLVVNLNYDTIFEIGARQAGHNLAFAPNKPCRGALAIAKPHGSINLFVDPERRSFWFGEPLFAGAIQPEGGSRNYLGFVPPRFGKNYAQHPVASAIFEAIREAAPSVLTFWGVGLTDSDTDLLNIFKHWSQRAYIEFINPDKSAANRASVLLGTEVHQFDGVDAWASY